MSHGAGLIPPEPPRDWTDVHELNETLRGAVVERGDYEAKDGDPFSVIVVESEDGQHHRVPCSRVDLRPLIERENVQVGDEVAATFWGMMGQKYVYTTAVRKAGQGQLA